MNRSAEEVASFKNLTAKSNERLYQGIQIIEFGKKEEDNIVENFNKDVISNNGGRLIALPEQDIMKIMKGFFKHRDIQDTWRRQTRGLRSIID